MIRLTLLLCMGVAHLANGDAQTLTTNDQGQRVIVYPDGTTQLFDEPSGTPGAEATRQATPQEEQASREAIQDQLDVLKDELKSLTSIAKKARGREAKLSNRIRKLRDSKKSSDRSQIEIVNQKLIAARDEYTTAEAARANNQRLSAALRQSADMSIAQREAYLRGQNLGYLVGAPDSDPAAAGASADGAQPMAPATTAGVADVAEDKADQSSGGRRGRNSSPATFATYDPESDPGVSPPAAECRRESDGIDEFTNSRRILLAPEVFFTYTSPELKPFLGDASLLTCNARLAMTGKSIILETEFVIRSQFAAKEFGVLPKGSQLTFRTVDGQKIVVRNQSPSQANYDPVTKVSTYKGRYVINKGARKTLERSLLDEVRVMWGTGFDDYVIYDMNFLKRQLACL